jgi:hypothetical protein
MSVVLAGVVEDESGTSGLSRTNRGCVSTCSGVVELSIRGSEEFFRALVVVAAASLAEG